MAAYERKTRQEVVDFEIDWATPLGGDVIETSAWAVTPEGIAFDAPPPTFKPALTRVWLSGGDSGVSYTITNTITTKGGRTLQQRFFCGVF